MSVLVGAWIWNDKAVSDYTKEWLSYRADSSSLYATLAAGALLAQGYAAGHEFSAAYRHFLALMYNCAIRRE